MQLVCLHPILKDACIGHTHEQRNYSLLESGSIDIVYASIINDYAWSYDNDSGKYKICLETWLV